jgi:hypothetical protein
VDSLTPTIISMTTTDPKQLVLQEELPTVVTTSNLVFPTKKSSATAILLLSNVFHANLIHKYTRIEVVSNGQEWSYWYNKRTNEI